MIQIYDSRGWTWSGPWSGDLLKAFIYSNFDPMGVSRNQKLKMRLRKISYFCHNVPKYRPGGDKKDL